MYQDSQQITVPYNTDKRTEGQHPYIVQLTLPQDHLGGGRGFFIILFVGVFSL